MGNKRILFLCLLAAAIAGLAIEALMGDAQAAPEEAASYQDRRTDEAPLHPQRRVILPHPDDPNEYLLPHELIRRLNRAGAYDEALVSELRAIQAKMTDPARHAALELVILGQCVNVNSPVRVETVRDKLGNLAAEHPGTWISFMAKFSIAGTYYAIDGRNQERIDAHLELLSYLKNNPLDPLDPFLKYWPMDEESLRMVEAPRDVVLWRLVDHFAMEWDLESAENMAAEIISEHWQKIATRSLDRLRAIDPELRERGRQHLLNRPTPEQRGLSPNVRGELNP